jgi:hypothetical protein
VVTPLQADAWERKLRELDLFNTFQDVPYGIRHGFDLGVRQPILHTYTPPNHRSATDNPLAIDQHLEKELAAGQISGPFEKDDLERLIGPFRTSPLGAIPKGEDDVRVINDFSFGDADHPAVNDEINPDEFQSEWGSYADMVLIATDAAPGSQGATLDVDAAFRRCPVRPDQQQHFVIHWRGQFHVDHCVAFGGASACGVFGRVADAFAAICRKRGYSPVKKWVDDFAFIRSPVPRHPGDPPQFRYSLEEILALGVRLGWPWKHSKTCPFDEVFKYLGFRWSLKDHSVSIPDDKRKKYIARIAPWSVDTGVSRKQAEQVHGTLVHCSLAVPDGRSRLVSISRFASSFERASRFAKRRPPASVMNDIAFWRDILSQSFCGSILQRPPPPVTTEFYVDASTSWGVGVVFDGAWDGWKLQSGWKTEGRDIGWAEMVAIELGIRTAIAAGAHDVHFVIKSDNMGVIGALGSGKSRNLQQNRVLQRIVTLMRSHEIWITSCFVPSAENVADCPSRGLPAVERPRLARRFQLPACLQTYIL